MLHPTLGRFMQRDPLGYVDGMSVYQYVKGQPLAMNDPSGKAVPIVLVAAIKTLAAAEAACMASTGLGSWYVTRNIANDKFKHCYMSCHLARTCGTIPSWAAGYLKEIGDEIGDILGIKDSGGFDWADIRANSAGMSCAGWESSIPLCGNIGRWFRQSCWDCCRGKNL